MKKVLIALIIIAGLIAAGVWFKAHDAGAGGEGEVSPAAKVETTPLTAQTIARTIEAFGSVVAAPSGEQVVSAPYDCIVRHIEVSAGATVVAGQVLLEIDPSPDAKLAADSARSQLTLANGTLAAVQQRYDLKLAARPELLAARQAAEDVRLKVESLTARGIGSDGRIVAASAGVVTKLELSAGTLVPMGTALLTVSTVGQLEARLGVEAVDAGALAAGQAVALESSNRPELGRVITTVRSIGAALDPATGAAEVRAAVPAGAPLLFGEHLRARIELQRDDHALVVPRSAVLADGDKQVLFTVQGGKAVRHEVQPGLADGDRLEVTGPDLHAGDLIVTLGNYELENGMAIQAPEKDAAGPDEKNTAKPAPEAQP